MARLLTYNYFINKYIFNNQICKYNNYLPDKPKSFIFNNTNDIKNFINYYHVKNHNFGDLSLADEIVINDGAYNKTWLIAGFNTQLDSDVKNGSFGKHHLTLIPKDYLFSNVHMNSINDIQGFANTEMFNITLPKINNNLSNILQHHLIPHKMMLSVDNKEKMKFFTAKSMLLNYVQAFGCECPYQHYYLWDYDSSTEKYTNNDFDSGDDIFQLPLFKQDVKYRTINNFWWLRTMFNLRCFTTVTAYGDAKYNYANFYNIFYVIRPFICLG